jgi:hypothetical protein
MKMLTSRVERIEQLVDTLAKTTRGLASTSKVINPLIFGGKIKILLIFFF